MLEVLVPVPTLGPVPTGLNVVVLFVPLVKMVPPSPPVGPLAPVPPEVKPLPPVEAAEHVCRKARNGAERPAKPNTFRPIHGRVLAVRSLA